MTRVEKDLIENNQNGRYHITGILMESKRFTTFTPKRSYLSTDSSSVLKLGPDSGLPV